MYNRNPNDVANERTDVPEIYEENRERLRESEAARRQSTDPVSGSAPAAEPAPTDGDEEAEGGS